jgi:hypothetical protein
MFARTQLLMRISRYTLFMKDNASNPALKNLSISERGRELSKLYKSLTPDAAAQLYARAARLSNRSAASKRVATMKQHGKGVRKPPPFAQFVKLNYPLISGTPAEKFVRIGAMWREQQSKIQK